MEVLVCSHQKFEQNQSLERLSFGRVFCHLLSGISVPPSTSPVHVDVGVDDLVGEWRWETGPVIGGVPRQPLLPRGVFVTFMTRTRS